MPTASPTDDSYMLFVMCDFDVHMQVTTMVIKVDLGCFRCYKKIRRVLCSFPGEYGSTVWFFFFFLHQPVSRMLMGLRNPISCWSAGKSDMDYHLLSCTYLH